MRWLAGRDGWRAQGGFVSRGCYDDYLQDLLRKAVATGPANRLLLEPDEAVDVVRLRDGWRIQLAMGRSFDADAVVLGLGAPPPAPPEGADADLLASPRYVADPWSGAGVDAAARHVLLLGAGLTMVDVALSLGEPGRWFTALSRRGLLPLTHAEVPPHPAAPPMGVVDGARVGGGAEREGRATAQGGERSRSRLECMYEAASAKTTVSLITVSSRTALKAGKAGCAPRTWSARS